METNKPIVEVKNLKMYFPIAANIFKGRKGGFVKAVDDVTFDIYPGETLGMVGESGCGKTTTGRALLQLYRPTAGEIRFDGTDLIQSSKEEIRRGRKNMQMIFQDPYTSLNPQMRVGEIIARPLRAHGMCKSKKEELAIVNDLMNKVGLNPNFIDRYPHEFSGGQRQRIGIARSLATSPKFICCDEPISALDVSIQAQIINLLESLQDELKLTYLFIAHDLSMVRYLSTRIAVMYLGKIVEITESDQIFSGPIHPYTKSLISAVPIPDPFVEKTRKRIILTGDIPNPANPPLGCNFSTRCQYAKELCHQQEPAMEEFEKGHFAACHFAKEIN